MAIFDVLGSFAKEWLVSARYT